MWEVKGEGREEDTNMCEVRGKRKRKKTKIRKGMRKIEKKHDASADEGKEERSRGTKESKRGDEL